LTETISNEKIVIATENTSGREDVIARKTIVYETLVDPAVVKVASEKLKQKLFTRFWFFKPKPENTQNSTTKGNKAIILEGEERLKKEIKASFLLDRYGRNVTLERLASAPSEKKPKKIIAKFGIEEVPENAEVDFVRERIVKRPKDINRIVEEVFEVAERVVIYTPQFRVLYKSTKTGDEKALEFDGVTANLIQQKKGTKSHRM
jgi:hypothetical protein